MKVIETILPIMMVMLLGFGLTRRGFLQEGFVSGLNAFVYWIALPSLIIKSLLTDNLEWAGAGSIYLLLVIASVAVFFTAGWIARWYRLNNSETATYLQGAFRGNLALIGLPLLLYVAGADNRALATTGILVLSPSILAYNISSVLLFARLGRSGAESSWFASLLGLRTNPLILATLIGFSIALSGLELPVFFVRFFDMIGATASPLALICIGANMAMVQLTDKLSVPISSALLKVALLPLIAWPLGLLWGLEDPYMFILLLYASCPTAAASVILAQQMGGAVRMASCVVAVSTAVSLIPLALVVWLYT